jgi:hypothetical protein
MRRAVALAAATSALLALPAVSLASGGSSIATAPMLNYGSVEAGGGVTNEFWRLPVTQGDHLTFDIDGGTDTNQLFDFIPLDPSVTDYTAREHDGDYLEPIRDGKTQRTWTAPFTGTGTLWVMSAIQPLPVYPYTFTATVTHATTLVISAPTLARRGTAITVRGSVRSPAGTPEGSCLIAGRAAPVTDGQCTAHLRLGRGRHQGIHVSFVPDEGWQAASASHTIRLAR